MVRTGLKVVVDGEMEGLRLCREEPGEGRREGKNAYGTTE
jgi:hypothetical protein